MRWRLAWRPSCPPQTAASDLTSEPWRTATWVTGFKSLLSVFNGVLCAWTNSVQWQRCPADAQRDKSIIRSSGWLMVHIIHLVTRNKWLFMVYDETVIRQCCHLLGVSCHVFSCRRSYYSSVLLSWVKGVVLQMRPVRRRRDWRRNREQPGRREPRLRTSGLLGGKHRHIYTLSYEIKLIIDYYYLSS